MATTYSTNHYPSSSVRRALLASAAIAAGLVVVLGLTALPAQAQDTTADTADTTSADTASGTTMTVNTDADENNSDRDCSLREAIKAANTNQKVDRCPAGSATGKDSIRFDLGSSATTITLDQTLGELGVTGGAGLVIDGGAKGDVTVSGNDAVRVFFVGEGAKLGLKNLTVAHGKNGNAGGGIFIYGGTLRVDKSTFSENSSSDWGGAIHNSGGALEVSASTFSQNNALRGAGITNWGSLKVRTSTFSQNKSGGRGGGIYNRGTLMVAKSTFSENSGDSGGGIANADYGSLTATNSTFYKNTANGGGGIYNAYSTVTVTNSTFSQNTASYGGGGIRDHSGTVRLSNTIVADSPWLNCWGTINDGGYNISSDASCNLTDPTSKKDTDPKLDPEGLQNNGGPTKNIAILSDSPARNAIPKATNGCGTEVKRDQRGVKRPQGAKCDIGAFEKKKR